VTSEQLSEPSALAKEHRDRFRSSAIGLDLDFYMVTLTRSGERRDCGGDHHRFDARAGAFILISNQVRRAGSRLAQMLSCLSVVSPGRRGPPHGRMTDRAGREGWYQMERPGQTAYGQFGSGGL